jgi:hypothetical protein
MTPSTSSARSTTPIWKLRSSGAAPIADFSVDDEARLSFEGRGAGVSGFVAADLEFLLGIDEPFRASDLPGPLDDEDDSCSWRRLVREGLLRIKLD